MYSCLTDKLLSWAYFVLCIAICKFSCQSPCNVECYYQNSIFNSTIIVWCGVYTKKLQSVCVCMHACECVCVCVRVSVCVHV